MTTRSFAVVTGASTGIGVELARLALKDGHDVLIVANEPEIETAANDLRSDNSGTVETLQADLSTKHGIDALMSKIGDRPVDALLANAGRGLGHSFLSQEWDDIKEVIDLNVTGTVSLIHQVGRRMADRNAGRILITGSIAGFMPGSFQAVYNGTKAFLDSFSYAIRDELKNTSVTVTCLMPGVTDTEFFDRADMLDTQAGEMAEEGKAADPAKVAKAGYEAMKKGEAGVTPGFMNKVQSLFAEILPETVVAAMHRKLAQPKGETGTA